VKVSRFPIRAGAGFNMTPLIDVVFLLIIFFLVSSHLARQESQIELRLPEAARGQEDLDVTTPRVTVNVQGDGQTLLAGEAIGPAELQRRLGNERSALGPDMEVRIRSDRAVPYRIVEPILLACARSGIWRVTFAVYRKGG